MEYSGKFCFYITKDNYKLEGFFNDIKSEIAILNVHGMGSFFWSNVGLNLFEMATLNNWGCFIFNNRGCGGVRRISPKIRGSKDKILGGFAYENFEECVYDISGAIDFLKEKGFRKIILCGHSTGAQKILYYYLNNSVPEVIGLIFGGAGDDRNLQKFWHKDNFNELKKYCEKNIDDLGIKIKPELDLMSNRRFYDLVKDDSNEGNLFDFESDLNHIKNINLPILVFYGEDDPFYLKNLKEQGELILSNCIHNKSKLIFVPGDHSVRGGEKELKTEISKWIKEIL